MVADLPAQLTAFVGRTQELADITALLDDPDCRLVTLVGQGGSGKTRMSLEVGTLLRQRGEASKSLTISTAFAPCNVYFVPLQPLNSPEFILSTEQQSVLRICRLVEGMPLALEITAAWLRRLPTDEIARQIERGLDILESPARNAPPRHRSIRAVFENSWNLLTETEQDV